MLDGVISLRFQDDLKQWSLNNDLLLYLYNQALKKLFHKY